MRRKTLCTFFVGSSLCFIFIFGRWVYQIPNGSEGFLAQVENNRSVRLNFLFLLRDQFTHRSIWEEWLKDAKEWMALQANNTTAFSITFTFHHDFDVDPEEFRETVPESILEGATIADPVKCKWGQTTPCMYQVLSASFSQNANSSKPHEIFDSDVYAYVSQDAVPVKRFSSMALYLLTNSRSQFFISDINYPRSPKHHQWVILSKKHAELLVAHKDIWTDTKVCGWQNNKVLGASRQASDDEFCPLYTLRKHYANPNIRAEDININSEEMYGYPRVQNLWADVNMGLTPPVNFEGPFTKWSPANKRTFVCWTSSRNCDGVGRCRKFGPCLYDWIDSSKFEEVILNGDYWFARKFPHDVIVKGLPNDEKLTFDEYLIRKIIGKQHKFVFRGAPTEAATSIKALLL